MATRYSRTSGDWNGAIWAATPGGAAGSASVPTASDDVYILVNTGSISLSTSIEVASLHGYTDGASIGSTFNANSYNITVNGDFDVSSDMVFSNLNYVETNGTASFYGYDHTLQNITVNVQEYNKHLIVPSYNGTTCVINLGQGTTNYTSITMDNDQTFGSLFILNKNDSYNYVYMYQGATVDHLIALGTENGDLFLSGNPDSGSSTLQFTDGGTCYGDYVSFDITLHPGGDAPFYIGSHSQEDYSGWLNQDPPKISTLVDPLTTAPASNSNWTFPNGYPSQISTGHDGGGYDLSPSLNMVGTATFDMLDVDYTVEQNIFGYTYTKLRVDSVSSTATISGSTDGSSWDVFETQDLDALQLISYKCVRPGAGITPIPTIAVGSINPTFGFVASKEQNASGRISKIVTNTISSSSRLSKQFTNSQISNSLVIWLRSLSQDSASRISSLIVDTQSALARIRSNLSYTSGDYSSLPSSSDDLYYSFSGADMNAVAAQDGLFFGQSGSSGHSVQQFKKYHNFPTAVITASWAGKTTVATTEKTCYLQIFNYNTESWETVDSNNSTAKNTYFELSGSPSTSDNSQYYDSDGFVAVRVYQ